MFVELPGGGTVTVTALPALHGPPGSETVTGPVIGFLLAGHDLQTVYISGDNASLDVVREIAERAGPVDVAILFAGAVQLDRPGRRRVPDVPERCSSTGALTART